MRELAFVMIVAAAMYVGYALHSVSQNPIPNSMYYKLGVADACLNVFENRQGKTLEDLDYKSIYNQTIEWRKNQKPEIVPGL